MGIRLGVIEYDRPSRPVKVDDVRQMLAVAGKDVIRLAWSSLNPDSGNDVKYSALAFWFRDFLNMVDYEHGGECIGVLKSLNLLYVHGEWVKPEFDL